MKLAIFGASSHIAQDLVASIKAWRSYECHLFFRDSKVLGADFQNLAEDNAYRVLEYSEFDYTARYDAIINFVGVGDPARAKAMGAKIFEVTERYDQLAMSYLQRYSSCKYIFLSSGAAYGADFEKPVTEATKASFPINGLQSQDWYAAAKFCAECRHRAYADMSIVDVRVFGYFSRQQSLEGRFFLSDILRSLKTGDALGVSPENIVRDYIVPSDFFMLIDLILCSPPINTVVDCYTRAPIDKFSLLSKIGSKFGLMYEVVGEDAKVNATGTKPNYYSLNRSAEKFGYFPNESSLGGILKEIEAYLLTVGNVG